MRFNDRGMRLWAKSSGVDKLGGPGGFTVQGFRGFRV